MSLCFIGNIHVILLQLCLHLLHLLLQELQPKKKDVTNICCKITARNPSGWWLIFQILMCKDDLDAFDKETIRFWTIKKSWPFWRWTEGHTKHWRITRSECTHGSTGPGDSLGSHVDSQFFVPSISESPHRQADDRTPTASLPQAGRSLASPSGQCLAWRNWWANSPKQYRSGIAILKNHPITIIRKELIIVRINFTSVFSCSHVHWWMWSRKMQVGQTCQCQNWKG